MTKVKLAIVYYSTYGTNYALARVAEEAAKKAGAEIRFVRVAETAPPEVVESQEPWKAQLDKMSDIPVAKPDDLEWANAYLFSAPTRYGAMASQMRAFIDTLGPLWQKGGLAGKAVSAMTSAQNVHGGQEATLLSFYTSVMHWGSVIVAPGYTDPVLFETGGNPYGYSHNAGEDITDKQKAAIAHQTTRLIEFAGKLAG